MDVCSVAIWLILELPPDLVAAICSSFDGFSLNTSLSLSPLDKYKINYTVYTTSVIQITEYICKQGTDSPRSMIIMLKSVTPVTMCSSPYVIHNFSCGTSTTMWGLMDVAEFLTLLYHQGLSWWTGKTCFSCMPCRWVWGQRCPVSGRGYQTPPFPGKWGNWRKN